MRSQRCRTARRRDRSKSTSYSALVVDPEIVAAEIARADDLLQSLIGEAVDTLTVKSLGADEGPFLGRIVSKLSP